MFVLWPIEQTECIRCEIGTFSAAINATSISTCKPCAPGYAATVESSTLCLPCPKGSYSELTKCTKCPKGTFNSMGAAVNRTFCIPCMNGTISSDDGALECQQCDIGMVPDETASSCISAGRIGLTTTQIVGIAVGATAGFGLGLIFVLAAITGIVCFYKNLRKNGMFVRLVDEEMKDAPKL